MDIPVTLPARYPRRPARPSTSGCWRRARKKALVSIMDKVRKTGLYILTSRGYARTPLNELQLQEGAPTSGCRKSIRGLRHRFASDRRIAFAPMQNVSSEGLRA
jgi:hypothetical protein